MASRHNPLHRVPVTLAVPLLALVATMFWPFDAFERTGVDVSVREDSEVGDIVIPFLLIIPAFLVARRRAREARLQAGQLRVLRVTIRAVHGIVYNSLNQLQLLRLQAEGHVPDDTLRLFDQSIEDGAAQLTALANMETFAENPKPSRSPLDVWLKG